MNNRKILIIGNGPIVLEKERGQEIDDFDGKIVRCNGYIIDGYEKYIGTRTDIYIIGQLNLIEQIKEQYEYILLYQSGLDGGRGLRKLKDLSPHNEIILFPMQEKDKIKDLLGLERHIEPTTGIIAVHWFMRPDVNLYLYGFDSYTKGHNYFSDITNPDHNKRHNSKSERVYIEWLIKQNIVREF